MRDGFDVKPRSGEGAGLWFLKIITGVLVIVILFIHLVVNHVVVPGGLLSFTDVVNYYQNPLIPIMEIAFLVFVISHSLIGLRSVLLDLKPSNRMLKIMNWVLISLGGVATIYGIWLVLTVVSFGR
jgi:succinate dehydrogenase / fumarate reductase membrane anchor subunit